MKKQRRVRSYITWPQEYKDAKEIEFIYLDDEGKEYNRQVFKKQ